MFTKGAAVTYFAIGRAVSAIDGSEITTGTMTGTYSKDGTEGSLSGTIAYKATAKEWGITGLTTTEMNGDVIGLNFTLTGALPIHFTIKTRVPLTAFPDDAFSAASLSTAAVTKIAAGIWNALRATYTATGSFGEYTNANVLFVGGVAASTFDGTAQAGGASTITLASGASATDDIYNDRIITIVGGTGAGQSRYITDYVGSTKVATVHRAWEVNPNSTSTYEIKRTAATIGGGAVTIAPGGIVSNSFAAGTTLPRVTLVDTITTYTGNTPQTGDPYARLGAPAGASLAADAAAVKADTAAVKLKTDNLPASPASETTSASILTAINALGGEDLTVNGTVNQASPAAGTFIGDSGLSATNDFYNGMRLAFTAGALKGVNREVTDYAGSTRTFTFANPFPAAPANGDAFAILGGAG